MQLADAIQDPAYLALRSYIVRDSEEAIYLDAMDTYLSQTDMTTTVNDIPLLKRPLQNRLYCAFARKPGYLSELFERRRLKLWVPFDAPENKELSDAVLGGLYPKIEAWLNLIYQPTCLPVPLPFVVYYFHKELRNAQLDPELGSSERIRRLLVCLQMEYYIFFMSTWWNEAFHGGKMFVLRESTIRVLEHYCSGIANIAGKSGQVILEHMRIASQLPNSWHNWMCYRDRSMEPSVFVWGRRGYGGLDPSAQKGVRIFCDLLSRKITTTRYGSSLFKRLSAMDQRLSAPDLDDIEGLLGLVRDQEWDAHGSLRVSDLLHHMLSLYRKTHQKCSVIARDNDELCRELDLQKEELRRRDDKIWDREKCLDDALYRVDCRERYIDELLIRVNDLKSQVSGLTKARDDALRSANEPPPVTKGSRRGTPRRMYDPYADDRDDAPVSRSIPNTPNSPEYIPPSNQYVPQALPIYTSIAAGSPSTAPMRSRSQHTYVANTPNQMTPAKLPVQQPITLNDSAQITAGSAVDMDVSDRQDPGTPREYPFPKTLPTGQQPGDASRKFATGVPRLLLNLNSG